jgi:hypothetical protein
MKLMLAVAVAAMQGLVAGEEADGIQALEHKMKLCFPPAGMVVLCLHNGILND